VNTNPPPFLPSFQRLYGDTAIFDAFSAWHPISFRRVPPLLAQDAGMDDPRLIAAETAHLAGRSDDTRRAVVEAYRQCGLLPEAEADAVKPVVDYFDADFFELMGDTYANAGRFVCALRWYREFIAELETHNPQAASDDESFHASVGYCLYSLGLFAETIAWTKSCFGPRLLADAECRALIEYEAQLQGGCLRGIERATNRARYVVSALDPAQADQITPRLKQALSTLAPFQESYIAWISTAAPAPEIQPDGYPFFPDRDAGSLTRHRMNLLFATCGEADALIAQGQTAEAKELLSEAARLEPRADIIQDRLKQLP
jgi:tetratricopeptide (TPR) repeat protein